MFDSKYHIQKQYYVKSSLETCGDLVIEKNQPWVSDVNIKKFEIKMIMILRKIILLFKLLTLISEERDKLLGDKLERANIRRAGIIHERIKSARRPKTVRPRGSDEAKSLVE